MNVNSRIARANFIGNESGPVASFTAYRSSNATIQIDDHYFTPTDNKANVCNTPMPVSPLWTIDSSFNGHVEFNQFVRYLSASSGVGYWSKSYSTSTLSVNAETNSVNYDNNSASGGRLRYGFKQKNNHKYLLCGYVTSNVSGNLRIEMSKGWIGLLKPITQNVKTFVSTILNPYSAGEDSNKVAQWYINNETEYTLLMENWQIIDLTQMFESTIADYTYNLEQGTEGAGVAFFRSIYPNDYYAYDEGTDEMVGSREGSIITLPIDVKTSIIPNIGSNNIFADCGYVEVYYVTI